ncbi:MAG: penicillin-insensitive murein endopeptidase [Hyphomicrobiaceae bacterium]|nr:penicillin-insensitive murein endopeptidase [Hyphomicrobiaceae bacterium]
MPAVLAMIVGAGSAQAETPVPPVATAAAPHPAASEPVAGDDETSTDKAPATGEPAAEAPAVGRFAAPVAEPAASASTVAPASEPKAKPAAGAKKTAAEKPVPAKDLFGAKQEAAALAPRAIGFYSRGCLAGAKALPIDGPAWQAMRLSRNRNWGHPALIALVERLAVEAKEAGDWPGLLVGDLTQPRGGPMTSGHASHQVGLDADIWLTPMPDRRLTEREREDLSATSMLASALDVDPKVFTAKTVALIKRAASMPEVDRVGVNPAIKVALCRAAGGDQPWLAKVQSWPGHHFHMHIRMKCPAGSVGCVNQGEPTGTSCAAAEIWYANTKAWIELPAEEKRKRQAAAKPVKPVPPKPPLTLAELPEACREVLAAGPSPSAAAIAAEIVPPAPAPAARAAAQ